MNKKLLFYGVATLMIAALTSGLYLSKDQQVYKARTSSDDAEPGNMGWAQIDLRTGEYDPSLRNEVFNLIKNKGSRGDLGLEWENRGPDNVGGRTRAIIELFGKPDTLIAGGTSGGLFVSYNGGGNWQPHTQFVNQDMSSSIIASIHQDTNSGKIYVGTGSSFDKFANSADIAWAGYGIFVSNDEGVTFTHLESTTPDNRYDDAGQPWLAVNRIQTNSQGHIFAATEVGLHMSTDGGDTWINPVYIDPAFSINVNGKCADVAVGADDKVLTTYLGGTTFLSSDGGTDKSFVQINDNGLPLSRSRSVAVIAPSNPDIMYIIYVEGDGCMDGVYKTTNGGSNWEKILEPFDEFDPFNGANFCQGVYDLALGVSPKDPNCIFIGGLSLWRFDGSLTRVASEFGSPPFQDVLENYVHADKHFFYFSPNKKSRLYCTTDGGISVSEDKGDTWTGLNKGYVTTQFYGVTHTGDAGLIIGGTQDNGTLAVLGDNDFDPHIGYQVSGGDGIDCDMSQIVPILFSTSQNGVVYRTDVSAAEDGGSNFPLAILSFNGGPFHTVVKLWENIDDSTSQNVVEFSVEPLDIAIATGNGILRTFNETVTPIQAAAEIIKSSIIVYSGTEELTIDTDGSTLIGDGTGSITFNSDGSMSISVTFDNAPAENSNVFVNFEEHYDANSVLVLESNNMKSLKGAYEFEHRLENSLNPGDVLIVRDPVQSVLLSTGDAQGPNSAGGSIRMYRNVLNAQALPPNPIGISGISGSITCIEYSMDGNVAFVGTTSGVYRITGLNDVYTQDDADDFITVKNLSIAGMSGPYTGVAIDPMDNNRLVVTAGGYGLQNRVAFTTTALSGTPIFTNVHGDLPAFPIYDAEFNMNEPNMVILGTEFGLYATADITAGSVVWSDENDEVSYVPTYDVRQQHLGWDQARNTGMMYVGTHGRGMWRSTSMVGIPEFGDAPNTNDAISDFNVYPNPVNSEGRIDFEASFTGNVQFKIYDMNGRAVKAWEDRVSSGQNVVSFNTRSLHSGAYFITAEAGQTKQVSKFLVFK